MQSVKLGIVIEAKYRFDLWTTSMQRQISVPPAVGHFIFHDSAGYESIKTRAINGPGEMIARHRHCNRPLLRFQLILRPPANPAT
jgi:hypothetical protein